MEPRLAARALAEIATLLELRGENRFKARAFHAAARQLQSMAADDIADLIASGEITRLPGIGPASLSILRELGRTGDLDYLRYLRDTTPAGLMGMLRVPGLGTAKIHQIHTGLGIQTLEELEQAARDGRLAALPRFGKRTAERVLRGIAFLRESGSQSLYGAALLQGQGVLALVRSHPLVSRAELAGSLRRRSEVVGDIDIVAACRESPERVALELSRVRGVTAATAVNTRSVRLNFTDGAEVDVYCVTDPEFPVALWRATGSAEHCAQVATHARSRWALHGDELEDPSGRTFPVESEEALYRFAGLPYVEPELREGQGEVQVAATGALPALIAEGDIHGVLHCHSDYSDGSATIAAMAAGAKARGWQYLGITDHSVAAYYARGLTRDAVLRQHEEIDALNAGERDFRVLKGIEADILPDGQIDYDAKLLDLFDYVVASVHSRFGMGEAQMTERVMRALDDPHVTVLAHPTGRLLLTREPYAVDLDAVVGHAAERGVAVELNADPHRLDLDWRHLRMARDRGVCIEIGPDAHSVAGLDNVKIGVGVARKGWLRAADVLNCRSAEGVLDFARARREQRVRSARRAQRGGQRG